MKRTARRLALLATGLLIAANAWAAQAGWRQIHVPGITAAAGSIPVALYYPTQAPERAVAMGPFTVRVAIQAPPDSTFAGLVVLSHGTGGSELGHSSLAESLARRGYLVAALRHPGDNWQDRSLLQASAARYFGERPLHVTRVIDALLNDPFWSSRIAVDERGPRIGAVGHSAGGYTVLALAGGQPEPSRIAAHCTVKRVDDPIFCSMGRSGGPVEPLESKPIPPLRDSRVRAVVALSPVGVVLSEQSLAKVRVPTLIYAAELDRFLAPQFHAYWAARHIPGVEMRKVPNAWHFAFMDSPSSPIATEDGDIGANPPRFDRGAFLALLGRAIPDFFDGALR